MKSKEPNRVYRTPSAYATAFFGKSKAACALGFVVRWAAHALYVPVDHPAHEPYGKRASANEKLKKYRCTLKTSVS